MRPLIDMHLHLEAALELPKGAPLSRYVTAVEAELE
jgi:hypothetical protein